MIRERQRGAVSIHALFQAASMALCFAAWFAIVTLFAGKGLIGGFSGYSLYGGIAIAALLLRAAYCADDDAAKLSGLFPVRLILAGRQTLFVGIVMAVFLVATKDKEISRIFLFSWLPVLYLSLAATNLAMPHFVLPLVFSKNTRQKFLLITRHSELRKEERLAAWLIRQQRMGITVVGVVAPEGFRSSEMARSRLGSPDQLERIFHTERPDVLMWMEPPSDSQELMRALNLAESQGSRLIFWDDLESRFGARAWSAEIDGLNFVHFRREPLESPLNRVAKRLFDITMACVAVFLVMPWICALVWIAHRIQSRGPLFFQQQRTGLAGQRFQIFKFRTMHIGQARRNERGRSPPASARAQQPLGAIAQRLQCAQRREARSNRPRAGSRHAGGGQERRRHRATDRIGFGIHRELFPAGGYCHCRPNRLAGFLSSKDRLLRKSYRPRMGGAFFPWRKINHASRVARR